MLLRPQWRLPWLWLLLLLLLLVLLLLFFFLLLLFLLFLLLLAARASSAARGGAISRLACAETPRAITLSSSMLDFSCY